MTNFRNIGFTAAAGLMGLALLAGCKSKTDRAIEQARAQAAATGQPQQIQFIDSNGDTDTITVTPPVSGQTQQVTTQITPAPPGPKPKATNPVVTPLGGPAPVAQPNPNPGSSNVAPLTNAPNAVPSGNTADANYVN